MTTPPRAAHQRRRRGAGAELVPGPRPRRGERPRDQLGHGPRAAGDGAELAEPTWDLPWLRRPDWEYLPHLADAHEIDKKRRRTDAAAEYAHVAQAVEGTATAHDRPTIRPEEARCDGRQSSRPHAEVSDRRGCKSYTPTAKAEGQVAGEIRGRGSSPGAARDAEHTDRAAAGDAAQIRGQSIKPGPLDDKGRRRAQERLLARNSHLLTSLADHAERVAKRDLAGDRMTVDPAAARLEALRRRILTRCNQSGQPKENGDPREHSRAALPPSGHSSHGSAASADQRSEEFQNARRLIAVPSGANGSNVDHIRRSGAAAAAQDARELETQIEEAGRHSFPSIEDDKIQFYGCRDLVHGEGDPGIATAAAAAARVKAWHSNESAVTGTRPS